MAADSAPGKQIGEADPRRFWHEPVRRGDIGSIPKLRLRECSASGAPASNAVSATRVFTSSFLGFIDHIPSA